MVSVLGAVRRGALGMLLLAAALGIAETKTAPGSAPAPAGPSSESSSAP